MAVQMQTRLMTPQNLPHLPSGIVEDAVRPAVWLVVVSKSKDFTANVVTKAVEEFSRLSADYESPAVVIRLEFIITQVPTSFGSQSVSQTSRAAASAYSMEVRKRFMDPFAKIFQSKKARVEMHVTMKDSEVDGLLLAVQKANPERIYFPVKKSLFSKEFPLPPWVAQLPRTCELICVQGSRVQREMGGPPASDTNPRTDFNDCLADLVISDRDDRDSSSSLISSPNSSSVEFAPVHSDASVLVRTPSRRRMVSLESHSGSFSIDANSGSLYADEPAAEPVRRFSKSFPRVTEGPAMQR